MKATLEQWRMFKAVVEHGGYAQAAEAIHKSQSTISYGVHKLQDMLGVQLLEVEGRKAQLTDHGKILLQRANQLLEQADNLGKVAASLGSGVEAKVRIAIEMIYPYDILFNVLEQFSEEYPNTRIELEEYVLNGGIEMLENGEVDLLISAFVPQGMPATPVFRTRFIPISAPDHPLQQLQRELTFDDLSQHRQIVLRDSSRKLRVDAGWLGATQRWTVTHASTSLDIIRRGLGYAWLSEHWVTQDLAAGTLKVLPVTPQNTRFADLYLIEAHPDTAGPATRYLSKLLANTEITE